MDQIKISRFARKNVISLPLEASIGEAIRLMYRNLIRHIPVMKDAKVRGIVNPHCIINLIAHEPHNIDFNSNLDGIITNNYHVVDPNFPLFDAAELISKDPRSVVLIEESETLVGIFTEIDLLGIDFLWHNITDHPITTTDKFGDPILFDHMNSADRSIHDTLKYIKQAEQDFVVIIEEEYDVRGIVDFFGIIHHIYYNTYRQGKPVVEVLNQTMHAIFPGSGAWYHEPVLLSKIRKDMYLNDMYYALIMDKQNNAKRIVTSKDIIGYLIEHSDYFGEN